MDFKKGEKVFHIKKHEWGSGVIHEVFSDKLYVKFFNLHKITKISEPEKWLTKQKESLCIETPDIIHRCIICDEICDETNLLSNTKRYHSQCYNNLLIEEQESNAKYELCLKIKQISDEIIKLNESVQSSFRTIDELKKQLLNEQKFFKNIINRITFKSNIITRINNDIEWLHDDISKKEISIKSLEKNIAELISIYTSNSNQNLTLTEINSIRNCSKPVIAKLSMLYDYWLSRPPDWEQRKEEMLDNAYGYCEQCEERGFLHVHHIKPISKGGNHRSENLIVLCEDCHSQEHGGKEFTYSNTSKKSALELKVEKIMSAIKMNRIITFHYKKFEGEESNRTIKPIKVLKKKDTLCVSGFCYLRNAERTFAISRITKLTIKLMNTE